MDMESRGHWSGTHRGSEREGDPGTPGSVCHLEFNKKKTEKKPWKMFLKKLEKVDRTLDSMA